GDGPCQARRHPRDVLGVHPGGEIGESDRRIRTALVTHVAVTGQQRDDELRFGNIDSETRLHTSLLSVASWGVSLVHTSCARVSRFRYRSTGRHTLSGGC